VIGVLEYAELFSTNPDSKPSRAGAWFLERATSHLKPDGVLILAIENKLGLKYWRGSEEDHLGSLFAGIAGYPLGNSIRTYSRQELLELMRGAGLTSIAEQYPYPDYKLPHAVVTRELIDSTPELVADLTTGRDRANYPHEQAPLFPDSLAARSLAKAGLLAEMANSFLFLGTGEPNSETLARLTHRQTAGHELAWHYASSRSRPIVTVFAVDSDDPTSIWVRKQSPNAAKDAPALSLTGHELRWNAVAERFVPGVPVATILTSHAYYRRWDGFRRELCNFLRWSLEKWKLPAGGRAEIDGKAIDAVFCNAIVPDDLAGETPSASGRYAVIDLEWELDGPMAASWFVFRNLFAYRKGYSSLLPFIPTGCLKELYEEMCKELGIPADYDADVDREAQFQSVASVSDMESARISIDAEMRRAVPDRFVAQRASVLVQQVQGGTEAIDRVLVEMEALKQDRANLQLILQSRVHRMASRLGSFLAKRRPRGDKGSGA
jgi:hypothetical protein